MSSAKWRLFCLGLNELSAMFINTVFADVLVLMGHKQICYLITALYMSLSQISTLPNVSLMDNDS